jgi:peptide/nickel transport system substrate-binding protein
MFMHAVTGPRAHRRMRRDSGCEACRKGTHPTPQDRVVHTHPCLAVARRAWPGYVGCRVMTPSRPSGGSVSAPVTGDIVGSPRQPRGPRIRLRPGRGGRVTVAALLVLGIGVSATYLLLRPAAQHRGGVLRMIGESEVNVDQDKVTSFDPALQFHEFQPRVAPITNDGLVGFRRLAGHKGDEIVPDLATALPTLTDGGRTYTFHLRKGVRYSTGEPVRAGDIRRGIERAVVHSDTTEAAFWFSSAIIGARACRRSAERRVARQSARPDCDLSIGISTDDRTRKVVFHLTRPTPDFLYQLALPAASAVPQDTPVDLPPASFLPATGPYRIRSYIRGQDADDGHSRLRLVRNPHFRVWSSEAQPAGYPDQIVLEDGYSNAEALARVTDGRAELLWFREPGTNVTRLTNRHGAHPLSATTAGINFLFLNSTKPPFDDGDARRAVAFALDRAALTARGDFLSGPVTCQVIPPGFAGYQPYCPFTPGGDDQGQWNGPDLVAARGLVARSGTRGAEVRLVVFSQEVFMAAGARIVAMLGKLGYRASLDVRPDFYAATSDPSSNWNAGLAGWSADYPTASSFVALLGSCNPDLEPYNAAFYCDPDIERKIAAALNKQANDPAGAGDAWTPIDRQLVDAAAIIPYSNMESHYFTSGRVGHLLIHPMHGPLIAQMWVR